MQCLAAFLNNIETIQNRNDLYTIALTNEIDIGNSDVSIVEDVTFPWELAPGIAVKKNIKAENTGKNNAAIRLRVDFSNPNMAERINYEYNSSMWTHDASSGYYYYNEVVAPGDTTE